MRARTYFGKYKTIKYKKTSISFRKKVLGTGPPSIWIVLFYILSRLGLVLFLASWAGVMVVRWWIPYRKLTFIAIL